MEIDPVDQMVARWTEERPDLNVSSMRVLARVSLAARLFGRVVEREYAKRDLNSASFDVLAMLRQVGTPYRLTPTQLYTSLRVSSGTMTNRIDQLERAGLVVRIPDPRDRRGLIVQLTPQGLEVVDALVAGHAELGQQVVRALPAEEETCLINGLRKLIVALERTYQEDGNATAGAGADLIQPYMEDPKVHEQGPHTQYPGSVPQELINGDIDQEEG